MQTLYVTTSNFIRHDGNLVDLTEYRRKLAIAQGQTEQVEEEQPEPRPVRTRSARRRTLLPGMMLDYAASAALVITALTFAAKIL